MKQCYICGHPAADAIHGPAEICEQGKPCRAPYNHHAYRGPETKSAQVKVA